MGLRVNLSSVSRSELFDAGIHLAGTECHYIAMSNVANCAWIWRPMAYKNLAFPSVGRHSTFLMTLMQHRAGGAIIHIRAVHYGMHAMWAALCQLGGAVGERTPSVDAAMVSGMRANGIPARRVIVKMTVGEWRPIYKSTYSVRQPLRRKMLI